MRIDLRQAMSIRVKTVAIARRKGRKKVLRKKSHGLEY